MIKNTTIASLILFSFFLSSASCQNNSNDSVATFPGGSTELYSYLEKNMQWRQGQLTIEGKVYVSFIVKENGDIVDSIIKKGLCESCDIEALRLVKEMPNWIPAKKNGQSVESTVTIPIYFQLSDHRD